MTRGRRTRKNNMSKQAEWDNGQYEQVDNKQIRMTTKASRLVKSMVMFVKLVFQTVH